MSVSKNRREAERWLLTAEEDLEAAILLRDAKKFAHLDKFYIPTRYPNGLPDLTPAQVYRLDDAMRAVEAARALVTACRNYIMQR